MTQNNPDTIHEAHRYFANAKKTIGKSPIEYGSFKDPKYVSEAAGMAYLSALKAINSYLLSRGMNKKGLPASIEEYRKVIQEKMPHNGKLMTALHLAYQNLHIFAYYRGGTGVKMVKEGFENCKKIIEMMENSLRKTSSQSIVNEPPTKYHAKKLKK